MISYVLFAVLRNANNRLTIHSLLLNVPVIGLNINNLPRSLRERRAIVLHGNGNNEMKTDFPRTGRAGMLVPGLLPGQSDSAHYTLSQKLISRHVDIDIEIDKQAK